MNIIILGTSGSGKGTQAKLLCGKLGLNYVSMGDILRAAAKNRVDIDETINKKGELVPDEITYSVLRDYLESKNIVDNILFDGYPRSARQYNFLKTWLTKKGKQFDLALLLEISDKEAIRRLSARRIDRKTGEIYNLITDPPPEKLSKGNLFIRDDDKPNAIKKRLQWYKDTTNPLIKILKKDGILIKIDGERPIDTIFVDIMRQINEASTGLHPGYLLPALRREQNPSEAKISSLSSTSLCSRFFAKGDKDSDAKKNQN